jgi:DNA-directed DNA polymerase III PolC
VENAEGYAHLCRLLSQARISEQDYADHRAGLCELPAATPNPEWRYQDPKQSRHFQVVGSIRTLTLLNEAHPAKRVGEFSFQPPRLSAEEMKAVEGLVDRCNFDFEINTLRFPRWSPPDGSSPSAFLRRIAFEGLHRRYRPPTAKLIAQLEEELRMIAACGYDEYFLTVWDLLGTVREAGIDWICRGSAADSLTIYCLGISNFCPVRFEMYFQRFLNEERMKLNKLPDIDLDFPWDKRDQVAQMVFDKYGKEHAAIVGGFSTFQARSALAEVGKVLGISDRDIRRVTEHVPHMGATGIKEILDSGIESRGVVYNDEPYTTAMELAVILDQFPRYPKMHPCGVVISRDAIRDISPTFPSAKNPAWPVTHYNMEACEQVGLIKLDLLSQAGLSVMRDTMGALKEKGIAIDLSSLEPWDDPQVWDMISRGEARAVHHIESPAMCSLSKACQPKNIDVLVAIVSVIRPGAANGGRKASFAARACGIEPIEYVHPSLEECLASTYGVMAYEEHVPQICEAFAGMTPGRADVLRRALAKDKAKVIAEMKVEFAKSASGIGRTHKEIADVWDLLTDFSGYSFNRAHSTAYALEAYESAFLKRYHPAEFIAKVLTNERGFYSALAYSVEARRLGLSFLPPDVNASSTQFHVEGGAIRVPIWKVKDLTQDTLIRIDKEKRRAPFSSLRDFSLRSGASMSEVENLIRVGAFDDFGDGRPEQVWQARQISQWPSEGTQGILFRSDLPLALPEVTLSEPSALDRLKAEMDLLGFPVGGHPLDLYPDAPLSTPIAALGDHFDHIVTIVGMVIADRVFSQANGDPMKFITIADRTGIVETELFASQYRWFGLQTVRYPMLKVTGKVVSLANGKGFAFELIRIDPAVRSGEERI